MTFLPLDDPSIDPDKYDIVMPLDIDSVRWLNSEAGGGLRRKALVPDNPVVDLCDDKLAFANRLIEWGYGKHVPVIGQGLDYPYILKRRSDIWGRHSHLVRNPADERDHAEQLASPDYFCQEFIPGDCEYATHMMKSGRHIAHFSTVKMSFRKPDIIYAEHGVRPHERSLVDHSRYLKLFAGILTRLGFEGACCFDYKLSDDTVKIFELNPRFGGSLALRPNNAVWQYARFVSSRLEQCRLAC